MKWNRKWKMSYTVLERRTLCCSSYKNRKLKVKPWRVGARERKKSAFFAPFILSEENFFKFCVLSQCIVSWIRFQNIHTFTYQKTLFYILLLLVFKIAKRLQCIHKQLLLCCFSKLPPTNYNFNKFAIDFYWQIV